MSRTTKSVPALLLENKAGLVALLILGIVALAAIFANVIFPQDPMSIVADPYLWPGSDPAHPLGTDSLGRDILVGIVYGSRVSLLVGVASCLAAILVGTILGALAGYFGGWVDAVVMRLAELFQTMPSLIFTIVVMLSLSPSIPTVVLAISLSSWPQITRLVRAEALKLRRAEFILASRVIGMGDARIIYRHLIPNVASIVVVTASIIAAHAILLESAISFLGLSDPNMISWGSTIGAGKEVLRSAWYVAALPGVAIFLTVLALSLLGNALNDALRPQGARE